MEPNSFGRKLGIGVRVASNIARERAAEAARRADAERAAGTSSSSGPSRPAGPRAEEPRRIQPDLRERSRNVGHGLGRGTKNFGQSFFGPFMHAGGVLWLEITGCFFALFALFFAQNVYQLRAQYAFGAQHQKFVLYCALTVFFVYFSGSSFFRARRKARKQRAVR